MKSYWWQARLWAGIVLLSCSIGRVMGADADVCFVCGGPFVDVYYSIEDKVLLQKRHVCKECEKSFPNCFVCGLPANTNAPGFVQLPDQRVVCARDAKTAVLRDDEGLQICGEVRDGLDRLFARFTSFPETNVTVGFVDRVHLLDMYKLAGNDYHCPDVWGYTDTKTNRNRISYHISVMTALPLSWFQATCAHEYGHTWVADHLTEARRNGLNQDTEEGFCELVSFLFMESMGDEAQMAMILRNGYTRGQIDLFVAAQRSYGINDVLDWMQYGTDARLSATEPGRIRRLAQRRPAVAATANLGFNRVQPTHAPDTLVLKAIFWDQKRPLAMVNDHTFGLNEEAKVHVGTTNMQVRCLSISPETVKLQVAGGEQTLQLKQ